VRQAGSRVNSIEKMMDKLGQQSESAAVERDSGFAGVAPRNFSDYVANKNVVQDTRRNSSFYLNEGRKSARISVMPEWDALLADEYRRIKRPLLTNAFGAQAESVRNGNVIVVTSSLPGEGKSFTAQNLAQSIAMERDKTVLLIDADITKSTLSRAVNLEKLPGLVDILLDDEMDLENVIVPSDFPCLEVIPAGKRHIHSVELLASNRMCEILVELVGRYPDRIIIFDSPPVLATPETKVLCDLAGQIVFVVESGKTQQASVQQALELLSENKEKPIGLVLNKNHTLPGLQYHGDYYGY